MVSSMKGSVTGPSARVAFDELMEKTPAADRVTYQEAEMGGVTGWWCRPPDRSRCGRRWPPSCRNTV